MAGQIPPAPVLSPEAHLIVFVHHTAPRARATDEVFGDCDRVRILGRSMLRAAYAAAVLNHNSTLHGQAFENYIDERLPGFVARWVTAYDWRRMMRAVPPHVSLYDAQETMRIFETYVGAVVAQQPRESPNTAAQAVLFVWIQKLIDTP